MNAPSKARFATLAALFGIISPFGWAAGLFLALIYSIAKRGDDGNQPVSTGIVLSIIFVFAIVPPLIAIISGMSARKQIQRSGGALRGNGQAWTGLILGYGTIAFFFCVLLSPFAIEFLKPGVLYKYLQAEQSRGP